MNSDISYCRCKLVYLARHVFRENKIKRLIHHLSALNRSMKKNPICSCDMIRNILRVKRLVLGCVPGGHDSKIQFRGHEKQEILANILKSCHKTVESQFVLWFCHHFCVRNEPSSSTLELTSSQTCGYVLKQFEKRAACEVWFSHSLPALLELLFF